VNLLALVVCAWLAPAQAGSPLAVLPAGIAPERADALLAAFEAAHGRAAIPVDQADFLDAITVVEVRGLPGEDECDGRVPVEDWRNRLEGARASLQLLAFTEALAGLVSLDAELVCLSTPPAAADLFRLELSFAEAHTLLAGAGGRDAGRRRFHEDEAAAALSRATALGASLSVPRDVAPDVLAAYEAARRRDAEDTPRVVVTGPGARVGARFNGRPLPEGPFDGVLGANLVLAAERGEVTAAARVRLTHRRTLIWVAPSLDDHLDTTLAAALQEPAEGSPQARMLLRAAARLLGEGEEVYLLEDTGRSLRAVPLSGDDEPIVAPLAPAPLSRWSGLVGAGPAFGWSNLGGGVLDGLEGAHGGVQVYGRLGLRDGLSISLAVAPWAVAEPIPVSRGGGTLFRATVPTLVGLRFGPRTRKLALEAGVDVGAHFFGAFTEGGEERQRVGFLVLGCAGLSAAVAPRAAVRGQLWFGSGLGYLVTGGSVGVEARL
jgi:hypothetical protein